MIGIVFIYFVGKKFYTLAEEKHKKKWPYAILGVLSYYFGLVTGGIVLGILLEIFMPGTVDSMNDMALSLLCIPFGLLACFGLYWIFKNAWQGDEIIKTNDFPAENLE